MAGDRFAIVARWPVRSRMSLDGNGEGSSKGLSTLEWMSWIARPGRRNGRAGDPFLLIRTESLAVWLGFHGEESAARLKKVSLETVVRPKSRGGASPWCQFGVNVDGDDDLYLVHPCKPSRHCIRVGAIVAVSPETESLASRPQPQRRKSVPLGQMCCQDGGSESSCSRSFLSTVESFDEASYLRTGRLVKLGETASCSKAAITNARYSEQRTHRIRSRSGSREGSRYSFRSRPTLEATGARHVNGARGGQLCLAVMGERLQFCPIDGRVAVLC